MTRNRCDARERSIGTRLEELTAPLLYLSSEQAGWGDGLSVSAFHEPREIESLIVSASPDIVLGLYLGGALRVERREAHACWRGEDRHDGDLFLSWGSDASYEVRSWSLSTLPSQLLNLQLSRALVARVAEEVVGVDLARLELAGHQLSGFRDPVLMQIALALWQELDQPTPAGKLYAQTAAQFLAVHLVRRYACASSSNPRPALAPPGLTDRQIKQVMAFIRAHLGEDLSLDAVALQVGYSPYHFARLFRKATGASLHQIVLRERITHAQRLLAETELPLARVAVESGFAHQSHLTRVFKQQFGRTPRAYRRGENGSS